MRRPQRLLPLGWADLAVQVAVWLGFLVAYQLARGVADHGTAEAFANGRTVIDLERRLHLLVEPDIQRVVLHVGGFLVTAVNWTYWLSQFPIVGLALLWIYLFRNESFIRFRNWIIATNVLGLVGYVVLPTAPPRMFPEDGFVDTLASMASLNHGSALVEFASNEYAAMPSLHSADALVIGFALATLVRSRWLKALWTLWPTWVWFSVMASGNHFWLDIAAGVGTALLAGALLAWYEARRDDLALDVFAGPRW